jgi:hypothetical protein
VKAVEKSEGGGGDGEKREERRRLRGPKGISSNRSWESSSPSAEGDTEFVGVTTTMCDAKASKRGHRRFEKRDEQPKVASSPRHLMGLTSFNLRDPLLTLRLSIPSQSPTSRWLTRGASPRVKGCYSMSSDGPRMMRLRCLSRATAVLLVRR